MYRSMAALMVVLAFLVGAFGRSPQILLPTVDGPDPLGTDPLNAKASAKAKLALRSVRIEDLAKAKLDVARGVYEARYKEFLAGKGTLDFLFDASVRLLESERAATSKEADLEAAFERHWIFTKQAEEMNKLRYDAGRIPIQDYLESKYFRLQAEIWLVEARDKNTKK
jgi:hypothetical protein